ncbi:MAG: LemA family protein [Hylemonella sp.]
MSFTLTVGLLAAILLFWAVGAYNRLVRLRAAAIQAFAVLDEQFQVYVALVHNKLATQGAEARPVLAGVIGACAQFETSLKAARHKPLDVLVMRTLEAAHAVFQAAWARLGSEPPDLAGAPLPDHLQLEWQHIGQQVQEARELFQARVLAYNAAIGLFPAQLLARLMRLQPAHAF